MKYRFMTLDVFTTQRLAGNPLAVVFGADDLDDAVMQKIAREFNLSETTFVSASSSPDCTADVRIFTPVYEMPFAGHPTVGTAVALALQDAPSGDIDREIALNLKAGRTPVQLTRSSDDAPLGRFVSPVLPEPAEAATNTGDIAAAIGVDAAAIGFDGHQPHFVRAGNNWLFVPLASRAAVESCRVNMSAWPAMKGDSEVVGVFVYTRGGESADADFHARMFAPEAGVTEDPATGSAVATLPGQILAGEAAGEGSHDWLIEQGFAMGRPSRIHLTADVAGGKVAEVRIAGHAVPLCEGTIEV